MPKYCESRQSFLIICIIFIVVVVTHLIVIIWYHLVNCCTNTPFIVLNTFVPMCMSLDGWDKESPLFDVPVNSIFNIKWYIFQEISYVVQSLRWLFLGFTAGRTLCGRVQKRRSRSGYVLLKFSNAYIINITLYLSIYFFNTKT